MAFFIKKDFIHKEKNNKSNMKNTKNIINYNLLNNLISSYDWENIIIDNDVDLLIDAYI